MTDKTDTEGKAEVDKTVEYDKANPEKDKDYVNEAVNFDGSQIQS